jgi:hypothetical protein
MKPCTKKQKEWLWFIGLWLAGLGTVAAVSYAIRFFIFIGS